METVVAGAKYYGIIALKYALPIVLCFGAILVIRSIVITAAKSKHTPPTIGEFAKNLWPLNKRPSVIPATG